MYKRCSLEYYEQFSIALDDVLTNGNESRLKEIEKQMVNDQLILNRGEIQVRNTLPINTD